MKPWFKLVLTAGMCPQLGRQIAATGRGIELVEKLKIDLKHGFKTEENFEAFLMEKFVPYLDGIEEQIKKPPKVDRGWFSKKVKKERNLQKAELKL